MIEMDRSLAQHKRVQAQENRRIAAIVSLDAHRERLLEQARNLDREADELEQWSSEVNRGGGR